MSPEERFEKIEAALLRTVERLDRQSAEIDKQNAGIGDLIRASGIFLESQKIVNGHIESLAEAHKETDEQIKMLIRMQEDTWKIVREGEKKIDKLGDKLDRVADMLE